MVNVAVLGGSGHVGKAVVEAINDDKSHSVIVLSRQQPDAKPEQTSTVSVDYEDEECLVSVLETHEIHTVISCLGVHDEKIAQVEAAVIRASDKSKHTKRFIASNWSLPNSPYTETLTPWAAFQRNALTLLQTTSLEWTEVANGYFLDYWGMPYIKTHLTPMMPVIDMENKIAAIPGTGDEPIAFSYSLDVARVVVKMLHLPQWQETTYVVGDTITWNEFLRLVQEARGSEFQIYHDDLEKLGNGQITELPNHVAAYPYFPKAHLQYLYATLEKLMVTGHFDLPAEKAANNQFPDIKMLTVKKMLAQTWQVADKD